ncbi:hypothetical protein CRYO30217_03207 [Parvicella tangerina]|uniref:Uncharacterized protein n=1 Tax=Parvicella tangerina TaxID=2829795 RepID=A0A916JQ43_9FLAO|nr:hypothetical protein CRYO30217_03207 [Parvicella tangerina]
MIYITGNVFLTFVEYRLTKENFFEPLSIEFRMLHL